MAFTTFIGAITQEQGNSTHIFLQYSYSIIAYFRML